MNPSSIQGESKPHVYAVWFERRDREGIALAMNSYAERPAVAHAFVQAQLTYELLKAVEAQNQKLQQLIELTTASDKANREWREERRVHLKDFKQTLVDLALSDTSEADAPVNPDLLDATTDWLPPVEDVEESDSDVPASSLEPASDVPASSLEPASNVPASSLEPASDVPASSLEPASDVPASSLEPASDAPASGVEVDPTAATTTEPAALRSLLGSVIQDWRGGDAG